MSRERSQLAPTLGLTVVDIDAILTKRDNRNLRDTCKDMLRMWQDKEKASGIGVVQAKALHSQFEQGC